MVSQLRPAWAPSRMRNSKWTESSCLGTPHSLSWYITPRSVVAQSQRFMGESMCAEGAVADRLGSRCITWGWGADQFKRYRRGVERGTRLAQPPRVRLDRLEPRP